MSGSASRNVDGHKMVVASGVACPPPKRRGLNRVEAAEYIGLGVTKFDMLVGDGRMPKPKKIDGRRVWDRLAIDRAFEAIDCGSEADANPWDD